MVAIASAESGLLKAVIAPYWAKVQTLEVLWP